MKKNVLLILSLLPFSVMSNNQDPDSVVINSNMGINLSHKVDNKFIGTEKLLKITYGTWGYWETVGNLGNCTSWSPSASTINLGVEFTQERWCDAKQMRERDVNHHYADGSVFSSIEYAYQTVPEEIDEERSATGTKNYIVSESTTYSSWNPYGDKYAVTAFLPLASTITQGVAFVQTKKWLQDYRRTVYTYNHWADGDRTLKGSVTESKTEQRSSTKTAVGTKVVAVPWTVGDWGYCNVWCFKTDYGYKKGEQYRSVSCSASACIGSKPATKQSCTKWCSGGGDGGR